MKSEDELEKEMLEDLYYLYQMYRKQLDSGTSSVKSLNTLIRALKHIHRYYSGEDLEKNNIAEENNDK